MSRTLWNPEIRRLPDEESWLVARRGDERRGTVITASDSRAILGVGYANECPLSVYQDKVSGERVSISEEDEERFLIGHLLEPVCARIFERRTGKKLKSDSKPAIRFHREYPWMGATLDAYYYQLGSLVPVEFKSVDAFVAKEWEENPPLRVQVQVQHQIAVCNAPYGWVLGFAGAGRVFVKRVVRDDRFIDALIPKLMEFRAHCETRNPPPVDFSVACEQALSRMHPNDNGLAITLPEEAAGIAADLEAVSEYLKKAEETQRSLKNMLRALMGDYTYGALPGGGGFSWKTQERKAYTVEASTSRVFRVVKKIPKGIEVVERDKLVEANTYGEQYRIEDGGQGGEGADVHSDGGNGSGQPDDQQGAELPVQADPQREDPE